MNEEVITRYTTKSAAKTYGQKLTMNQHWYRLKEGNELAWTHSEEMTTALSNKLYGGNHKA